MIVSLGSAGHISGREYHPGTQLSQTLNYDNVQRFWTFYEWKRRYINSNYYYYYMLCASCTSLPSWTAMLQLISLHQHRTVGPPPPPDCWRTAAKRTGTSLSQNYIRCKAPVHYSLFSYAQCTMFMTFLLKYVVFSTFLHFEAFCSTASTIATRMCKTNLPYILSWYIFH